MSGHQAMRPEVRSSRCCPTELFVAQEWAQASCSSVLIDLDQGIVSSEAEMTSKHDN